MKQLFLLVFILGMVQSGFVQAEKIHWQQGWILCHCSG
jgi:hypothetical protein